MDFITFFVVIEQNLPWLFSLQDLSCCNQFINFRSINDFLQQVWVYYFFLGGGEEWGVTDTASSFSVELIAIRIQLKLNTALPPNSKYYKFN